MTPVCCWVPEPQHIDRASLPAGVNNLCTAGRADNVVIPTTYACLSLINSGLIIILLSPHDAISVFLTDLRQLFIIDFLR